MKKKHIEIIGKLFKPILKRLLSVRVVGITLSASFAQE